MANDSENDVRSEDGVPETVTPPQLSDQRRRGRLARRVLLGFVGTCLAVVIGFAGWLYWTHPSTTSVPLPAGIEEGEDGYLSFALPSPATRYGTLEPGPLRVRNHQWIGTVTWCPFGASKQSYEMRLGGSVHIEGLGMVTLLEVNAPPVIPEIDFGRDQSAGGWDYRVNIVLDPGLSLCTVISPCPRD